jgi:hypothetical protein
LDAHAKRTAPTPPPCTPHAQRFCSLRVSLTSNLGSAPPTTGPLWGQGSRGELELLHPSLSPPMSNRAKRQPLRLPPSLSGNRTQSRSAFLLSTLSFPATLLGLKSTIRVYWIATRRAYTTSLGLKSEAFDTCLATCRAYTTSLEVNSGAHKSLVRLAFVRSKRAKTHDVVVLLLTVGRAEHTGQITETVRFIHLR